MSDLQAALAAFDVHAELRDLDPREGLPVPAILHVNEDLLGNQTSHFVYCEPFHEGAVLMYYLPYGVVEVSEARLSAMWTGSALVVRTRFTIFLRLAGCVLMALGLVALCAIGVVRIRSIQKGPA